MKSSENEKQMMTKKRKETGQGIVRLCMHGDAPIGMPVASLLVDSVLHEQSLWSAPILDSVVFLKRWQYSLVVTVSHSREGEHSAWAWIPSLISCFSVSKHLCRHQAHIYLEGDNDKVKLKSQITWNCNQGCHKDQAGSNRGYWLGSSKPLVVNWRVAKKIRVIFVAKLASSLIVFSHFGLFFGYMISFLMGSSHFYWLNGISLVNHLTLQ